MTKEENPIVFTISQAGRLYTLVTNDSRVGAPGVPSPKVTAAKLIGVMRDLTTMLNAKGYAVLFEVD